MNRWSSLPDATYEKVQAWNRKPRKRIPRRGAKAKREQPAHDAWVEGLKERSEGWCEATEFLTTASGNFDHAREVCGKTHLHEGCDPHHIVKKGQGGKYDLSNGIWLCRVAHDFTEHEVARSREFGLLRRR